MSVIRKLPDQVINQIKAGEVVERPSSVVKELLENALDAQASEVEIELIDGGRQLIRIVDNGTGMSSDDAIMALERHATSKLSSAEDLDQLATFGFRGEALPSIAAVSHFTLRTRLASEAAATQITVQGGVKGEISACAMPVGTEIIVRDLFVNVPARRKFLRATATELGHVIELFQAMALAYYRVGLKLSHNGRALYDYPQARSLKDRLHQLLDSEADDFVEVNYEKGSFKLEGFVQKPELAKPVPKHFITFVNGRLVRDRIIRNGVLSGYTGLTMKGLVPGCVLFVSVEQSLVDVNAHPNKTEIRFNDAALIQDLVTIALQSDLRRSTQSELLSTLPTKETIVRVSPELKHASWLDEKRSGPTMTSPLGDRPAIHSHSPSQMRNSFGAGNYNQSKESGRDERFEASTHDKFAALSRAEEQEIVQTAAQGGLIQSVPIFEREPLQDHPLFEATYLGQFRNCYLLFESKRDLLVVDQHAFHERVLFEELSLQIESSNGLARQSLLTPLVVPVPPAISDVLAEEEKNLLHLGFEIEIMANRSVALHSLPTQLDLERAASVFDDVVARLLASRGYSSADAHPLLLKARKVDQEWLEVGVRPANLTRKELFHLHLATVACHSAVRSGDPMNPELVRRLLMRGTEVDFFAHCPHGRPVWRRWSEADVAQWFARI
jgi:DNA mismatch repair protein MutL